MGGRRHRGHPRRGDGVKKNAGGPRGTARPIPSGPRTSHPTPGLPAARPTHRGADPALLARIAESLATRR